MKPSIRPRKIIVGRCAGLALLAAIGLVGCGGSLLPKPAAPPVLFTLNDSAAASPRQAARAGTSTLLVAQAQAAAGHDSRLIAYSREPNRIDYFAASEWVAPPAAMLTPLLARAVEQSGAFRNVLRAPSDAAFDWRLATEGLRLIHEFSVAPSRVRLTLRVSLLDSATRRVLAGRDFEVVVTSASPDAAGGVAAAQTAALQLAQEVAAFCAASLRP